METDEHTPVSRPRTKAQERADFWIRAIKTVVGPLMAAVVAIGVAYVQRSSDKAEVNDKAKAVEQKVDNAKAAADKAIAGVKADVAVVSNAAQPVAQLAVETHEDVATRGGGKRRPRATDPKLLSQVQKSITDLKKVEAKARLSVPPKSPTAIPDAGVSWKTDGQVQ